tara:strand:- start:1372 stop:2382 length:1011 start_codon:yes stop_codon:yes gene_type:complete
MPFTNRTSLTEWNEYKNTEMSTNVDPVVTMQKGEHQDPNGMQDEIYSYEKSIKIALQNGPYDSVDSAKNEVTGFVNIMDNMNNSDLVHSVNYSLSPNNSDLICSVKRYSTVGRHRPEIEPGSSEQTLENELNVLKFRYDLIDVIGNNALGIKSYADETEYNAMVSDRSNSYQREIDLMDSFFTSLSITDRPASYKNSWICLKKNADITFPSSTVHYLNQHNLTFIMQTSSESDVSRWETYTKEMFSDEKQRDEWNDSLKTNFNPNDDLDPLYWKWHWRSSYQLDSDIWAINISMKTQSAYTSKLMLDFIQNVDDFTYDWISYPCNLYVGSIAKILS